MKPDQPETSIVESDAEIGRPVIKPLVRAAKALGLDVREPIVLGAGANVVVHLAPSPVVARVATLTAEVRGGALDYLRRERDISTALDERGLDVIKPTDIVDPGPHVAEGGDSDRLAFLLFRFQQLYPVDVNSAIHAEIVGRSLATLIAALAELPPGTGEGNEGQPWGEIHSLLRTVEPATATDIFDRIIENVERLNATEPDDPWQLVHGDAHKVNVAFGNGKVTWFDFEDANRRPLAWDLTTLRRSWPAAGEEACKALNVDPLSPSMRWHHELREVYALLWNLLYAMRYRRAVASTAERLDRWLQQH